MTKKVSKVGKKMSSVKTIAIMYEITSNIIMYIILIFSIDMKKERKNSIILKRTKPAPKIIAKFSSSALGIAYLSINIKNHMHMK